MCSQGFLQFEVIVVILYIYITCNLSSNISYKWFINNNRCNVYRVVLFDGNKSVSISFYSIIEFPQYLPDSLVLHALIDYSICV